MFTSSFVYYRVCRRWNELTKSRALWKIVDVELYEPGGSQNKAAGNFTDNIPSCATHIRLDFRHRSDWTDLLDFKKLCVRLKRCPNLQMLFLRASKLSDHLQSVIDLCTQFLQKLKILVFYYSVFPHCPERKKRRKKCRKFSKIEILDLDSCELGRYNKPPFFKMHKLRKLLLGLTYIRDSWFEGVTFHRNPLEVLDIGMSCIGSWTFRAIHSHVPHLKELYICMSYVEDRDLCVSNFVLPHLQKICLNECCRITCEGIVSLIQKCPSLQHAYVDFDVILACAAHPFFVQNKCKLGIVKVVGCSHRKLDYLHK